MSTNSPDEAIRPDDWVSQAEAAVLRGVSRQAISKLVAAGRLPTLKFGGRMLVGRAAVVDFRPDPAGRPAGVAPPAADDRFDRIAALLDDATPETRRLVFDRVRGLLPPHPLEAALGVRAEAVLDALHRAKDLTLRMFRGVLAEAAFGTEVVARLPGWTAEVVTGDPPYDWLLADAAGPVRVQVKLQRSAKGQPLRWSSTDLYVVETQRTRGGRRGGKSTRPYTAADFDVLAVALQPSCGRWDAFRYTPATWLLREPGDPALLRKLQPVAAEPNADWTDDFPTAVGLHRSGATHVVFEPPVRPRRNR